MTDQFMVDIKAIDKIEVLCGRGDQLHLENLQYLLSLHKVYEVRTVVVLEMVDIENTLGTVAKILRNYPSVIYKLIRLHATGLTPIQKENIKNKIPSQAYTEELKAYVTALGIKKVEII